MRPRANWPVCPPKPTAAPPVTSPARTPPQVAPRDAHHPLGELAN
ncbi:hypothetical protein PENFLA_c128G10667, partial [Penicillium flavigenum]